MEDLMEMLDGALIKKFAEVDALERTDEDRESQFKELEMLCRIKTTIDKENYEANSKERELDLKEKELDFKEKEYESKANVGKREMLMDILKIVIPATTQIILTVGGWKIYDKWLYKGLKFEETGSVSSGWNRNLINKMTPRM